VTVWCFGSINIDYFYALPHLPVPGETLAATTVRAELGGKGANQSVAAARAGARVRHLGAVGPDGARALAGLAGYGVLCEGVQQVETPTGHAVIMVDPLGENAIIIDAGANRAIALAPVLSALEQAALGDILLLQNETAFQVEVARAAMGLGMEVIYSAAPFEVEAVRAVLPFVNTLVVNAVEAAQLLAALNTPFEDLPVETVVVTRGSEGASWHARGTPDICVPALPTQVVDTTGAGDCFTGVLAAALSIDASPEDAMHFAAAAAAIQVSRPGTAAAMPARAEIEALINERR